MKQGKRYLSIVIWIFLAAIVVYFGYHVAKSLYTPMTTTTAVEYEAGAGYYATGFVARDESLIRSSYAISVITVSEGQRVAAGGQVATGYLTGDAQARQSRIQELKRQVEQLQYAWKYSSSIYDQAQLDTQISNDLIALNRYICRRDMNSAGDLVSELKGLVLRRSTADADSGALQTQIETAQSELDALEQQSYSDTKAVTVSAAGYFSGSVDGYETVLTPEALDAMSTQDYRAIEAQPVDGTAIGKLVHGDTWYYVTLVPAADAKEVEAGDSVQVTFARDFYVPITMTVRRIGGNEAGYRLLVLESDEYMQNITMLRQQSADVVFQVYSGIRVPKDAVRVDENGQAGVYILEGAVARWKAIDILHDNGESYVVTLDKSSTNNLWPGDEIIVGARNLYDGKVVSGYGTEQ